MPESSRPFLEEIQHVLKAFGLGTGQLTGVHTGLGASQTTGPTLTSISPADGLPLAQVTQATPEAYAQLRATAKQGFAEWRTWPAPRRGEVVRQIGEALRANKAELGALVSLEMGKVRAEGEGEVQEIIDICDFAVGLSRQLYGLTMTTERPGHRLYEQWHPLGVVGVITAFNFPVAVWGWNAMLAAVCGNATLWKPSEKTPLSALACQQVIQPVLEANGVPAGVFGVAVGGRDVGAALAKDPNVALVSATGSIPMGRNVGTVVSERLGKSLLELGGNNAVIVTPNANFDLALRAILFAAVGTCGQRCTTARRLIVHEDVYDDFKGQLTQAYGQLPARIGHPLAEGTLIGPLIDEAAVEAMQNRLAAVQAEGGTVLAGGKVHAAVSLAGGYYVEPALVEALPEYESVRTETFAPILYLLKYAGGVEQAIAIQNGVPQGLSSSIFSNHLPETEKFLSAVGSDCGIANVNIGPSGAEIGGAFGGEKETGGGRESGSDAWKAYMRRQTVTINYAEGLPLAQGIRFDF